MKLHRDAYVAIRKHTDDGHEWLDLSTISDSGPAAYELANEKNAKIPTFGWANPIVRIVRCVITEED